MIASVTEGGSKDAGVVKALGLVVGLLTGLLALLYAVGGGALALRLYLNDLPSLTVVPQLPRQVPVSIALTQIVLPALAAGALYAALRLLAGSSAPRPRRLVNQWNTRSWPAWSELLGAAMLLALAAMLLGALPAVTREDVSWKLVWVVALAFFLTVLVMLVALKLRAELAARHVDTWNTMRPAASMTLIVVLASLPACVMFAGTFRLLNAAVCTKSPPNLNGVLIGETNDRVYLGEVKDPPRRVVSIPFGQVDEVYIGGEADVAECRD